MGTLSKLTDELVVITGSFLDMKDILSFTLTSSYWRNMFLLPHYDVYIWAPHLARARKGKFVSPFIDAQLEGLSSYLDRTKYLITDAKRGSLTPSELCSITFAFRFKALAGEFWASLDPYWQNHGLSYMCRSFREDGVVVSPDADDSLEQWARQANMAITWRMTKSRLGKKGAYLQINRWPSMVIERDPETWGWIISNQWVAYVAPSTVENLSRIHVRLEKDIERFL